MEPLVLQEGFSAGFVQTVQKVWDFSSADAVVNQDGRLVSYQQGASQSKLRKWVAKELGSIRNVSQLFMKAVKADTDTSIAVALSPFDINYWLAEKSDHASHLCWTTSKFEACCLLQLWTAPDPGPLSVQPGRCKRGKHEARNWPCLAKSLF